MGSRRPGGARVDAIAGCRQSCVAGAHRTGAWTRTRSCAPDAVGRRPVMQAWISPVLMTIDVVILLYFLAINTLYLAFSLTSFFLLMQYRRQWTPRALEVIMRSPAT